MYVHIHIFYIHTFTWVYIHVSFFYQRFLMYTHMCISRGCQCSIVLRMSCATHCGSTGLRSAALELSEFFYRSIPAGPRAQLATLYEQLWGVFSTRGIYIFTYIKHIYIYIYTCIANHPQTFNLGLSTRKP